MITLEFNDQQLTVIGEALGNSPYKTAAPVLAEIQKQLNDQVKTPKTIEKK